MKIDRASHMLNYTPHHHHHHHPQQSVTHVSDRSRYCCKNKVNLLLHIQFRCLYLWHTNERFWTFPATPKPKLGKWFSLYWGKHAVNWFHHRLNVWNQDRQNYWNEMQQVNHHQAISEFHLLMGVMCVADAITSLWRVFLPTLLDFCSTSERSSSVSAVCGSEDVAECTLK